MSFAGCRMAGPASCTSATAFAKCTATTGAKCMGGPRAPRWLVTLAGARPHPLAQADWITVAAVVQTRLQLETPQANVAATTGATPAARTHPQRWPAPRPWSSWAPPALRAPGCPPPRAARRPARPARPCGRRRLWLRPPRVGAARWSLAAGACKPAAAAARQLPRSLASFALLQPPRCSRWTAR